MKTSAQTAGLQEAREFALEILNDPKVRESYLADARAGTLAPQVAVKLMEYAWGKPVDKLEIREEEVDLTSLSNIELAAMAEEIKGLLLTGDERREMNGGSRSPDIH
jgi:hypothetical protein